MANQIEAIANCRVSSNEQLKNNSLRRQNDSVRQFAEKLNVKLVKTWSQSVSSKKGNNVNRKDITEMLDYCKKHRRVKYLLIDEVDRYMRSMEEGFHFIALFRLIGVKVRFASNPELTTDTAVDSLLFAFEMYKAEGSNEERQHKTISGERQAIREGRYPFSPKFGYMKPPRADGEKAKPHILRPELGELLGTILSRLAEGLTDLSGSLSEYNNSNYVTSGKGRRLRMDRWRQIVVDPFYAGIIDVKKQINERNEHGLHEPLITKDQHLRILDIVNHKAKRSSGPRKGGNPEFPLNTILFCEKCYKEDLELGREGIHNRGKFCGGSSTNGKGAKKYPKYQCRKCGRLIGKDDVNAEITMWLDNLDFTEEGRKKLLKALDKIWKIEGEHDKSQITQLNQQLANMCRQKDDMLNKLPSIASEVVLRDMEAKIEQQTEEIAKLEAEIRNLTNNENENRGEFISFALEFADNLGRDFLRLLPDDAKKCKLLLFPDGFFMDANKKVYIPKISPFYRYRANKKASDDANLTNLVHPTRFERATPSPGSWCSIQLSYGCTADTIQLYHILLLLKNSPSCLRGLSVYL